jgi:hypothetical protein
MFVFSKPPFYNKKLSDYCKQSTIESIRRLTEIYNKKKTFYPKLDKTNYQLMYSSPIVSPLVSPPASPPGSPPRIINICVFLSISTMLFYFFSSTKMNKLKNI